MFIDVQTFSYFVSSSFPVPSQFLPSYFPKLIRAKVHGGNTEGQLHWSKMSFLKSLLKQNAVYQSNFQMSRQCLQRSDMFYLTLQRFTVSTYIGDGLQSEDFQTFFKVKVKGNFQMFIDVQTFSYFVSSSFPVPSQFQPSSFPVPSQFLLSFLQVPSQLFSKANKSKVS